MCGQRILLRADIGSNLLHNRRKVGYYRHPPLAASLGNVCRDPHEPLTSKVSPLQTAQLGVSQPGAQAEEDRSTLASALGSSKYLDHLSFREPILLGRPPPGPPRLFGRIVLAQTLFHRPAVEAHELRAIGALRVCVRPTPERALYVLATNVGRVAVMDVFSVGQEC